MTWRKIICWIRGHEPDDRFWHPNLCKRCGKALEDLHTQLTPQEIEDVEASERELRQGKAKVFHSADELIKDLRNKRIAYINRNRHTKFAHAEHFKRRQPTTARKLWNPQAQPKTEKQQEEEENS